MLLGFIFVVAFLALIAYFIIYGTTSLPYEPYMFEPVYTKEIRHSERCPQSRYGH